MVKIGCGQKAAKIFEILRHGSFCFLMMFGRKLILKEGVPPPNAHNRSKVVLTTCTEEVCKEMREKTKIKVDKLLRICLRGYFEEPATQRLQSGAMFVLLSNSLLISQV
ncbi:hypothetical protein HID58_057489 [Brassica napus]|uniref:Uncharacterized protein n=1 Tax=Brassica napus TaxID=3708 RepID=A0ABQ8ASQ3_BRANA|nr:hypothetical protein HID58_057489 [Brassica napus]